MDAVPRCDEKLAPDLVGVEHREARLARGQAAGIGAADRSRRIRRAMREVEVVDARLIVCASSQRRTIHVEVLSFRVGRRTSRVDRCAGKLASISKRSKYIL